MHIAAHYENLSVAQLLLNRGASVNFTPQVSAEWEGCWDWDCSSTRGGCCASFLRRCSSSCQGTLVRWDHAEGSTLMHVWEVAINNQCGPFLLCLLCRMQPCVPGSSWDLVSRLRESWCCRCRAEVIAHAVAVPLPAPRVQPNL